MKDNKVVLLEKGHNVALQKEEYLKTLTIGLGWDVKNSTEVFDLDASIVMLNYIGKTRFSEDFIFYNNKESKCGSVLHMGDNRTGQGEGDDEKINVILDRVPLDISKLVILVSIHNALVKNQNFGQVYNSYVRLLNNSDNNEKEVLKFNLTEEASSYTVLIFGEIYRYNGGWKFKAVGEGFTDLVECLRQYGIEV